MATAQLIERTITVSARSGGPSRELVAIVDTGATHCQIPEDVARDIGAEYAMDEVIQLPNGRDVRLTLIGIWLEMDQYRIATTATLGPAGSPTLLGKAALAQMGLGVDAEENRLIRQVVRLLAVTDWPTF